MSGKFRGAVRAILGIDLMRIYGWVCTGAYYRMCIY